MTRPVYVDPDIKDVPEGSTVILSGDEARHAVTVRRTKVGEQIDVVNGCGYRATISVTATSKTQLSGTVEHSAQEPAHKPHTTLVQALAKGGRDEQAIETATEYGADSFIPWQADRSIVSWSQDTKAAKGQARWQATAKAAAKQSRRSWIPQVRNVVSSKQLVSHIVAEVERGTAVYVCHESATEPLRNQRFDSERVMFIVGPEGGITDDELNQFVNAGAMSVLLGEHVLRSATAGPWAIAVIRANA
ncbi:16S rRNA (uracil(1498)-N(3))-methyltransferase [Arcanobacterium phocae]|uniref:16S rRNA (uracil(1498)-N(3))-methyltransferase n=1 Tax=Arcanobacterium phocae TaxID=131112 RepID=UPI001C1259F5|nr:16S rRNA (uracil(1498)-N(3))-methyltransferase [Arcanobacterium phocae]